MSHNCNNFKPTEPPAHAHYPGSPISPFPINDCHTPQCEPCLDNGWPEQHCPGDGPGRAVVEEKCSVVPPPVPPVRYVPGMNVQEQLNNMAARVNTAIERWNMIQGACYRTLDNVVGAAVNNDVYYAPDEVRYMDGYDNESACPYQIVEARACDRSGKPIFVHLRPAFGNTTNSGARENIQQVSFVTSAQMVMTASMATETHWAGTTLFCDNPGAGTPDDTVWVAGWTRNGVLRFFPGDVSEGVLRQNRMVNCIGPVFPVLEQGKLFTQVVDALPEEAMSVQAMGWKTNGNKVFLSCGVWTEKGISPKRVAKILQSMGVANAVITSYQKHPVSGYAASPIAGTDSTMTYADDGNDTIGVPGMTGGMTFLGKLSTAPIQWSIPQNCAAWVITKKPSRGWQNSFTTEVANVVQRLGNQESELQSVFGQIENQNDVITKMQYTLEQHTTEIAEIKSEIGTYEERFTGIEERLTTVEGNVATLQGQYQDLSAKLDSEIATREQQYQELTQADANEKAERIAADEVLDAKIAAEQAARESADTILQNHIDQEKADRQAADAALAAEIDTERHVRAQADANLQAAIEAEASARSTKDTQHEARMDALQAKDELQQQEIDELKKGIKDGSALPIATTTSLGVVQIGKNLTIDENGVLSGMASGEGGGAPLNEGHGITITDEEDGSKTISADMEVVASKESVDELAEKVENNTTEITNLGDNITNITEEITSIKNGEALPVASATTLGGIKIGANLSISADGVLSASAGSGEGGDSHTAAAGEGINVEFSDETKVYTISLNEETRETLAKVPEIEADVADVKGDVEGLKTANEENNTELESVKTEVADNSAAIAALQDKDKELDQKDAEQDAEIAKLGEAVNQSGSQNEENEKAIAEVKEEVETVKSGLAEKVDKAGDTMTGSLTLPSSGLLLADAGGNVVGRLVVNSDGVLSVQNGAGDGPNVLRGIATPSDGSDAANKSYVDTQDSTISAVAQAANTAAAEASSSAAAAKTAADEAKNAAGNCLPLAGGTMSGDINLQRNKLVGPEATDINSCPTLYMERSQVGIPSLRIGTTGNYNAAPEGIILISKVVDNSSVIGLDAFMGGTVDYKGPRLMGVGDPKTNHDAANKAYVDTNFSVSIKRTGNSYVILKNYKPGDGYTVIQGIQATIELSTQSSSVTLNANFDSTFTLSTVNCVLLLTNGSIIGGTIKFNNNNTITVNASANIPANTSAYIPEIISTSNK